MLVSTFFSFSDFAPTTSDILHVLPPPLATSRPPCHVPAGSSPLPPWTEVTCPAPSKSSRASPWRSSPAPAPGRSSPAPLLLRAPRRCPGGARPRRPLAEPWRRSPVSPRTELARASPTWSLPAPAGRSSLPRPHLIVSRVGLEAGAHQQLASGRTPEQPEPASSFSPADLKRSHES
jgi:hypothetical protein